VLGSPAKSDRTSACGSWWREGEDGRSTCGRSSDCDDAEGRKRRREGCRGVEREREGWRRVGRRGRRGWCSSGARRRAGRRSGVARRRRGGGRWRGAARVAEAKGVSDGSGAGGAQISRPKTDLVAVVLLGKDAERGLDDTSTETVGIEAQAQSAMAPVTPSPPPRRRRSSASNASQRSILPSSAVERRRTGGQGEGSTPSGCCSPKECDRPRAACRRRSSDAEAIAENGEYRVQKCANGAKRCKDVTECIGAVRKAENTRR
jgi:hypothetical protein